MSNLKRRHKFLMSRSDPVATAPGSDTKRPNKIRRNAQQHNSKTDSAIQRKLVKQAERDNTTSRDKEERRERMSRNPEDFCVGGAALSKNKHTHCGQCKENHVNRYHVIQNLFKLTSDQRDHNCE